jgi:hypothetical protein
VQEFHRAADMRGAAALGADLHDAVMAARRSHSMMRPFNAGLMWLC